MKLKFFDADKNKKRGVNMKITADNYKDYIGRMVQIDGLHQDDASFYRQKEYVGQMGRIGEHGQNIVFSPGKERLFKWGFEITLLDEEDNVFRTANKSAPSQSSGVGSCVEQDGFYMPPDHGDICWHIGAESFNRKEVADLLYTQRSMIYNDLVTAFGDNLTAEMFEVLKNPRKPKY